MRVVLIENLAIQTFFRCIASIDYGAEYSVLQIEVCRVGAPSGAIDYLSILNPPALVHAWANAIRGAHGLVPWTARSVGRRIRP